MLADDLVTFVPFLVPAVLFVQTVGHRSPFFTKRKHSSFAFFFAADATFEPLSSMKRKQDKRDLQSVHTYAPIQYEI